MLEGLGLPNGLRTKLLRSFVTGLREGLQKPGDFLDFWSNQD